ncbi:hypothetical protein AAZX31_01G028700 [Glycine max]|uniref:Uncharacterized protein n=2 Tax=Glycine subgen. Soja TaxID=1462606 RepID=K7K1H0_SOYBN|nr:hypothetical protein JHK85_000287 [Glycine max]KAG5087672.1 hypothetical protein JHK86_000284 [Glycine max]KAH1161361.1 hypothetical protein GYH30_000309 [Glycine max]KRH74581.1 hypothetical protein GLYMA_01G029700v4 [Glycine max]RZC28225.1 hypothetical protein D0Y65_000296 [Glycine soja]
MAQVVKDYSRPEFCVEGLQRHPPGDVQSKTPSLSYLFEVTCRGLTRVLWPEFVICFRPFGKGGMNGTSTKRDFQSGSL